MLRCSAEIVTSSETICTRPADIIIRESAPISSASLNRLRLPCAMQTAVHAW